MVAGIRIQCEARRLTVFQRQRPEMNDPLSREVVSNVFDTCHNEGRTIVMVTHDPAAATRAGRRLTLQDGKITEATRIATAT